jgi:hypothetical protein
MDGASSVQSLGNLFTTTTTNALDRSMTLSSPQRRQFRMPSSVPAAFSAWRSMMSPYPLFLQAFLPGDTSVSLKLRARKGSFEDVGLRCEFCVDWRPVVLSSSMSPFVAAVLQ